MKLLRKIYAFFRGGKLDAEMSEEMRLHLERRVEENVASGLSPEEARYAALRKFGGVEQAKEIAREQRTIIWLEQSVEDVRYAARQLARTPGFTATAGLTLALGIGLVTLQFSFAYAVMLTGPRFEGVERVVNVTTTRREGGEAVTSLRHFAGLRAEQTSFDRFAAFRRGGFVLGGENLLPRIHLGAEVTDELLTLPNVPPLHGRVIQADDTRVGAPRVVVLGWRVWQSEFAGDPQVVGHSVRVEGEPATIIGVMPADFEFPVAEELWTNLRLPPLERAGWLDSVQILGRLRPGVEIAQAQSELETLVARLALAAPARGPIGRHAVVAPFGRGQVGTAFQVLVGTLLALAVLVLALACLNIANLLYARSLRQRRELAVRAALGASRGRLVRQTLCLSTLLAGLGAFGGVLLALWCLPTLNPLLADPRKPYWLKLEINWPVVAAVVVLTILVGVIAGWLPAWRALRLDAQAVLRDGGSATGLAAGRAGRWLVVAQIALAAAVLVVGAVLGRGVLRVAEEATPPDAAHVLEAADLSAPPEYALPARAANLLPTLLERTGALPGVQRAALARRGMRTPIVTRATDDRAAQAGAGLFPSEFVSPAYFAVFGVQARSGRVFTDADGATQARVVVINESCAQRFWPGANPVGERLRFEGPEGLRDWHEIVGVVPDLPMSGGRLLRHVPGVYAPIDLSTSEGARLLLRTSGEPALLANPVREVARELTPDQPFRTVLPLTQAIGEQLRLLRLISGLAVVFGGAALLLAALGIFAVQAFLVEGRRREFGVRLALGAQPRQILHLVLERGMRQLVPGLAAGLALGWGLSRVLRSTQNTSLFGPVTRIEPAAFALVAGGLSAALLIACWLPARRAAKVDPLAALRNE